MQTLRTTFLLFSSIFIALTGVKGQESLDILTLSGRYGFPKNYDSIYQGKAREAGFMAALVAPVKVNERSIWYNSLNYFYWHVGSDEETPEELVNPVDLHGIILRTGLYLKFSGGRAFQLFLAPRFMSDLKNINADHFQMGALFLYEKKFRHDLKMGFGVMYNQEFFGPYVVPLVNMDWRLSEKWSINGLFPVYGKIEYRVNDKLSTGISHFGLITTYRLGDEKYEGDYMERKSIDESLFARYRLTGNLFVEGRFGYALGRSYTQYESDQKVDFSLPLIGFGDNRLQKNISFHDGLIMSLRLVYSIALGDQEK